MKATMSTKHLTGAQQRAWRASGAVSYCHCWLDDPALVSDLLVIMGT